MRTKAVNWKSISSATEQWTSQRTIWLPRPLLQQLDPRAQAIYAQMITRLQRDMLLLLMILTIPVGIFFSLQLFHNVWVTSSMPAASFVVHTAHLILVVLLAAYCLRRRKVAAAWAVVLALSLSAILFQIWLLQEPGVLIFALLSMAVPAIVMPLRVSVLLAGGLLTALFLIVHLTFAVYSDMWSTSGIIFAVIMAGFACIGVVIRRFVGRFAQTTVEIEREAAQRGKLEQQMLDLHQHVAHIASLEHDLRQPLRAIQGHLTMLAAETADAEDLTLPALAAAQRADRLINNLLDQARAQAREASSLRRPVDLSQLFATLQRTAPGLARYYTDPPVPIDFTVGLMSEAAVDQEQLERAILNVLDNALAYSPPDGRIAVRAWTTAADLLVEVEDMGPGIPDAVVQALCFGEPIASPRRPRPGLGLRQVSSMTQSHGGRLTFHSNGHGTIARLTIPLMGQQDGHEHRDPC